MRKSEDALPVPLPPLSRPRFLYRRRSATHVARADVNPPRAPSRPTPPRAGNAETPWNAASLLNQGCCWGAAAPLIGWFPGANQQRHRIPSLPFLLLSKNRAGVTETSLPSKQPPLTSASPLSAGPQTTEPSCGRLSAVTPERSPYPFAALTSLLNEGWPGAASGSGPGKGLASSVRVAVAGPGAEAAAWSGTSCAPLWSVEGLRPLSRFSRCCWYWWKRLGSCPAGLARTFFFRRFFGAARGVPPAGARLQLGRGAGARD